MLTLPQDQATQQFTVLNSFLKLTKNPVDFTAIYDIDAVFRQTPFSALSIDYLKAQPGMAEMIREHYLAPIPDLDLLLSYPTDSLGSLYANHLKTNGFDPAFYRKISVQDDATYIALRRSQTHDIHHIVTGFGTDLPSELGLQAFEFAQMRSPLAVALLVSGIVHSLNHPMELEHTVHLIQQGWQMGLNTKPFMAQRWENHWEKSVAEWRKELEVEAITSV